MKSIVTSIGNSFQLIGTRFSYVANTCAIIYKMYQICLLTRVSHLILIEFLQVPTLQEDQWIQRGLVTLSVHV